MLLQHPELEWLPFHRKQALIPSMFRLRHDTGKLLRVAIGLAHILMEQLKLKQQVKL
jgi:hypothetical protein